MDSYYLTKDSDGAWDIITLKSTRKGTELYVLNDYWVSPKEALLAYKENLIVKIGATNLDEYFKPIGKDVGTNVFIVAEFKTRNDLLNMEFHYPELFL